MWSSQKSGWEDHGKMISGTERMTQKKAAPIAEGGDLVRCCALAVGLLGLMPKAAVEDRCGGSKPPPEGRRESVSVPVLV
jgi:hypothetical protein